jgi:hypothetical protein
MTTPEEDIEEFLRHDRSSKASRLQIAVAVSEAMVHELQLTVAAWGLMLRRLQTEQRTVAITAN